MRRKLQRPKYQNDGSGQTRFQNGTGIHNLFFIIKVRAFINPGTPSLASREKEAWLLVQLVADLGIIHVTLVLDAFRMQKFFKLRRLPPRFQKKASEARACAPERTECETESEKPIQWKSQKSGEARNMDHAKKEQSQLTREAMETTNKSALGMELHGAHNSLQTAMDAPVGTMGCNVFTAGFWTCVDPSVLYYHIVCNFWNHNVYLMPLNVGYVLLFYCIRGYS